MSDKFTGPTCATCRFYLSGEGENLCRRYPPQVISWINKNARTPSEEIIIRSQFPIMQPSGWCGEHLR